MEITKAHIKVILKKYMLQNNIGFAHIDASISMDKKKVLMVISEEPEENNYLYN